MSGSPVNPSDEAVPEGTPSTTDEEPGKDADDPRERVIEAFEEAAEREAVADAAIEAALNETVAEAIADAESVEASSDAAIQQAYEERAQEAAEAGLEGSELEDAVAQAAADADVQEAIADEAIAEALEETVVEAVQDARSVEAMSDAAIVGELADDMEGIAADVERAEAAEAAETTEGDTPGSAEPIESVEAPESAEVTETAEAAATTETENAEPTEPPTETAAPTAEPVEAEEPDEAFEAGSDPFRGPGEWYVVHTYAGYENKVKTNLESRIHTMQMEDKIFDVHIPMEDVMEIKSGKKQVVQRKVFPGYLLVKMVYDNDSWYVVRNTPGVTGFVAAGTGSKPTPLSRREVEKILAVKKEEVKPTFRLGFEENDVVRIISGPFADFNGTISEINLDQSKLKVLVNIFDRETPVELSFDQVAKV
ncbi:MAG TPA: transcription termination/antitermination protein NusG [Actinomycetota bacterium]|nr:transcription termination/antitermination protein NusG [Actinomycetota bacterium]